MIRVFFVIIICSVFTINSQSQNNIDSLDKEIRLEVDGGISKENIVEVSKAGADTFVAGSAIFNTKDYKDTISNLKSLID